jgi:hypothetical protein
VTVRVACGSLLSLLCAGAALAQGAPPPAPDANSGERVVPYCIEPMPSMPEKILALIEPKFRCPSGTHLTRDSRPARVVPTGEESSGRPFVLRFGAPESANAWFVRGFTTGPAP